MSGGAYRLAALCSVLCLYACTTAPAVEALCGNRNDDDGDDLADCKDSDCQASDECVGPRISQIKPPGSHMKPPPRDVDAGDKPSDAMVGDAWSGENPDATAPPEDAQVVPPIDEDGGSEGCPPCAANETCVDGVCQPGAPTSGRYTLRLVRGTVPSMNDLAFCYDACGIPAGACACFPDPYVKVWLVRGEDEQEVGTTSVVEDALTPEFAAEEFPLELAAGDGLRFDVYDYDQPARDNLLYDCNADLRGVSAETPRATEIRCVGMGGVAALVRYEMIARLTPQPPGP